MLLFLAAPAMTYIYAHMCILPSEVSHDSIKTLLEYTDFYSILIFL